MRDGNRRGITRRAALAVAAAGMAAHAARADEPRRAVRIGVLTDQNGALSSISGGGSIEAVRMAVEDFGGVVLGLPVQVLFADHQNKPDLAVGIARRWFDSEGVDMITDLVNSSVALAVQDLARQRGKVTLSSTGGILELMGKQCSVTGATWANDTYSASVGLVRYFMGQRGLKRWYLIGADYAFGHSMLDQASRAIAAQGGQVLGQVFHPLGNSDFSSFLLTAQASDPEVILLGNASVDLINSVKQARETRLRPVLATTVLTEVDARAMGLQTVQGLTALTGFYWDLDERTRAFSKRFLARHGAMPTQFQAGGYSAALTYLKAVQAAGSVEGNQVMAAMRAMPVEDMFSRNGSVRVDGRLVHDMLVAQVKQPQDSTGEWDLYSILDVLPGRQVFRPLSESDCPLART